MDKKREPFEVEMSKDEVADVIRDINRYYSEVTIIKVSGECPYGHKEGEKYKVTGMNHAGICGGLWHVIQPSILALQYEGGPVWEKAPGFFKGLCSEMGRVQVEVKRKEKQDTKTLKMEAKIKDMTGKGYAALDKYKVFVEILGVERHCMWAHREGQRFEIDPFNIGKVCGALYWQAYHFLEVLFGGGSFPWEAEPHIIHGACPDIYNQTIFRLIREER
ncbi:MAG: TIGR04076 family protein [Deltaproteobacteria bacterium]|nr:TIGR04076 family protein [Deltaproteobacteria bacterium]